MCERLLKSKAVDFFKLVLQAVLILVGIMVSVRRAEPIISPGSTVILIVLIFCGMVTEYVFSQVTLAVISKGMYLFVILARELGVLGTSLGFVERIGLLNYGIINLCLKVSAFYVG